MTPKTIEIYLVDGKADGIKTVELSGWIGKAIIIPRNRLKDVKKREESHKPAVYFLIGKEYDESILPNVYIGEGEDLWERLVSHVKNKEFWQIVIAFISKDKSLGKTDIKYLERRCLKIAKSVSRCVLQNKSGSSLSTLSESGKAKMEDYLNNLKMLLTTSGYPILQEPTTKQDKDVFYCQGKGALGKGKMTNDGFIVYKDSTASTQITDAVRKKNERLVVSLIQSGHLSKISEKLFKFEKDYIFNTPSAASCLITGNSTNGWITWKAKEGKTLKQVEKEKLEG